MGLHGKLLFSVFIAAIWFAQMREAFSSDITDKVFFDIDAGSKSGRIVVGLFGGIVPKTVENFKRLVEGLPNGKGYKGTKFLRVIPSTSLQGGDVLNNDGTGVYSSFDNGEPFGDENYVVKHTRGTISMAKSKYGKNGSQFNILLNEASWLDGSRVAFGEVMTGMNFLEDIAETTKTSPGFFPVDDIVISDCGVM